MKKIFVIAFFIISYSLFSFDLSWNSPETTSNCNLFFLEKNIDEIVEKLNTTDSIGYDFALVSSSKFKKSVKKFFVANDDTNFLQYRTKNVALNLSLITGSDYFINDDFDYFFNYYGFTIKSNIKNKLLFNTNWWSGHFKSNDIENVKEHSPLLDSWRYGNFAELSSIDNVTGNITYLFDFGKIILGRGKYQVGNNIGGSIILNDDCDDYGYFASSFEMGDFSLQFLHGMLIPDSTKFEMNELFSDNKIYDDKFIVTHKFNWKPSDKFNAFLGEHIIYGKRSIDLSYTVPHLFYRAAEHRLGDRDNALMYCGFNWKYHSNQLFYYNMIIDELTKSEIFNDWWGNKFAVQLGNSIKYKESKLTLEFTAIRPWLYTHKYLQNKFSHNKIGLGFPAGSNLIQFSAELNLSLRKNISFDTNFAFIRQGTTGNDFNLNYNYRDLSKDDSTFWLDGKISNKIMANSILTWQILSHHKIKFGFQISESEEDGLMKGFSISYQATY